MNALVSKMLFKNRSSSPPGPNLVENARLLYDFVRDQIAMLRDVDERYGPVSRFWLGTIDTYLVTEPDLIEEALVRKFQSFQKDVITRELEEFLGSGLLTAEGEFWRNQRKLIAPALQRRQIAHYADIMVAQTERKLETWDDGEVRPFDRDVMEVTLRVVVQALFDLDLEHRIEKVADALDATMAYVDEISHSFWRFTPDAVPTPNRREYERATEHLDSVIYDLIDSRRQGEEGDDLLYRLIEATDDEGNQMGDEQLRDEVITLFLAGHETTALAITYAWYLLSEDSDRAAKLHEEVDEVLGDRRAGAEDVPKLEYTEAVVKEAMRLYPPAWIIGREALEEVELGDVTIPEGAEVLFPQCIVHRDGRWYDEPDAFRPERWLEGIEEDLPRFAYFPFGGGARICIGNHFAKMEAVLVIATIAQHVEMERVAPDELETDTSITQRPAETIQMKAESRKQTAESGQ